MASNRILTAAAAQTLQDECDRDHELLSWIVMQAADSADVIARPVTSSRGALPCILIAATLHELRGMMPTGLKRSRRQPADPPGVIEAWFSAGPYGLLAI